MIWMDVRRIKHRVGAMCTMYSLIVIILKCNNTFFSTTIYQGGL